MRLPQVTAKSAPIWLPIVFLIRDFLAWQYVFSYEPGITEKAVRIHHFLLIPGVFYSVAWSTPINVIFGVLLGFLVKFCERRDFPYFFSVFVLASDLVITGILDFLAVASPGARRLFRVGMLPGRLLSHWLFASNLVVNADLLFTITLFGNFGAALLLTFLYLHWRNRFRSV